MGGIGSGRMFRWGAKATTESQHDIDIRWLKKQGLLRSGVSSSLSWSCKGKQTGSIGFKMEAGQMILNYRHRPNDGEWEDVKQIISLSQTPCNFGGYRKWFLCPRCWKRVAVLYGAGKYFYCRHCHDLAYSCQQETPPFRLTSKAQKIRKRLGASLCTNDPIFDKPKGMHWKTFNRLKREAYDASDRSWLAMANRFGGAMMQELGIPRHLE